VLFVARKMVVTSSKTFGSDELVMALGITVEGRSQKDSSS